MDTGCSIDCAANAFRTRDIRGDGTSRLLGPHSSSFLASDRSFRSRFDGMPAPEKKRQLRETLATLLRPLVKDQANDIAQILIREFGCISRIFDAPADRLAAALRANSLAADAICAARDLVTLALREHLVGEPVDITSPHMHDYLRSQLLSPLEERLHVIFLDASRRYLADETVARGSAGKVSVPTRQIIKRALDISAGSLLLAHNHPSGSCKPSVSDRNTNKRFAAISSSLGIDLADHLVVSSAGIYSLRREKLL